MAVDPLNPKVAQQIADHKAAAAEIDRKSAEEMLAIIAREVSPTITDNQIKVLTLDLYDEPFERQPKLSPDGAKLTITSKKGVVTEIDAAFLREKFGDIVPEPKKKTAGQLEMELARLAAGSITHQGQLCEMVGAVAAENLLKVVSPQAGLGRIVDLNIAAKPRPGSNGKVNAENPWSYPPGDAEGDRLCADYIKKWGTAKALNAARSLSVDLGRRPLRK